MKPQPIEPAVRWKGIPPTDPSDRSADVQKSTIERGLTGTQARAHLGVFGKNRLVRRERFNRAREILRIAADPMAIMLAASATVYFVLGETRDAVILLAALVPVLGVDVLLEARSRAALNKLASQVAPRAKVVRDGNEIETATEDVVPGDILVLVEGDIVHADGIVRSAANLAIDESSLTGESEPQNKQTFRGDDAPEDSRFWAGSLVLAGYGRGEVTATGARSRFGETAALVPEVHEDATPLQRRVGVMFKCSGSALVGWRRPVHLVWLELIVHPVSALIFEAEPGTRDQMKRPPRRRDEPLVPLAHAVPSLLSGLVLAAGAFVVYALRLGIEGEDAARGAALAAIVLGSILLVWTERAGTDREGRLPFPRSVRFWAIILSVIASLPLCLYVRPLPGTLHLAAPSLLGLALAALTALAAVAVRPIYRNRQRQSPHSRD